MIRSQVEEYFAFQCWTTAGSRDRTWFPHEGNGHYDTYEIAAKAAVAEAKRAGYYDIVRVIKVVRSVEFFDPIDKECL